MLDANKDDRLASTEALRAEIAARDALLGDAYYVLTYVEALAEDSDTKAACKEVRDKIAARQALAVPHD